MITSAFLFIFYTVVGFLVGLLPEVSANSSFGTAITTASGFISGVYSFMPSITVTLLSILAFDILFESSYLLYKVVYWIIRRFPTQS